ncbi:MAG: amino acid ABC transporter permease [Butyricicoccus sp.]|nr:amino acid ABC transporter permease [Butyricicoccus sp.]
MNETMVIVSRLCEAFLLNVELFVVTLIFSIPLGIVICCGSRSKFAPLAWLVKTFVWIIRGTPLMLQVIVFFFVPPLLKLNYGLAIPALGRFSGAAVAFVINYACYFSEIYRGGIDSIPRGQYEAGQVLGMTKFQIFKNVTLLQVIKRIVPSMGNEIITLVKDTSLARIIANKEIIMMANEYSNKGKIWPLFATGIYFLLFVGILTIFFGWLEKKLDYFRA